VPLVVLDPTLLVAATTFAGSSYRSWPDAPPITSNAEADCVSVVATAERHGRDFGLVVSAALLRQVEGTLRAAIGLRQRDVDAYLLALLHFARRSGGAVMDDPAPATALPPHLDVPISLAQRSGAILVGAHPDLRAHGLRWGGTGPVLLGAREFSVRADASRRARRT